jgi:hypothetical protein
MTDSNPDELTLHRIHIPTVVAMACVAYASAVALHELGHALAGYAVGGRPTLISSTDVRGDWGDVGALDFVLLGVSGSLVNWLLAILGIVWYRRSGDSSRAKLFPWLLISVNGFLAATYMIVSPLFGVGDWMTILRRFEPQLILRIFVVVIGANVTLAWFGLVAKWLGHIVIGVPESRRVEIAGRLAMTAWLTGGAVTGAAALWSPIGVPRALLLAVLSSMGATFLMLPAARLAKSPRWANATTAWNGIGPSLGWIGIGLLSAAVFIFVFGPGIEL